MQKRSIWITPKKAFVTGEMAEKRVRATGYTSSTFIGAAPHIFGQYFLDTHGIIRIFRIQKVRPSIPIDR